MRKLFISVVAILLLSCSDSSDNSVVDPSYTYFLVAERDADKGDSYILPLKDAVDIEEARAMISDPTKAKIVMAEINKTAKSHINRDLLRNKVYSWKVAEFIGFVDVSAEIYDGWPEYVEDNYNEWVNNTKGNNDNGMIGFWDYTVVREVERSELTQ